MSPALFALFTRSLREDARSRALVWARAGMALTIIFVMLQYRAFQFSGAPGRDFFGSIVVLNTVLICVATLGYFAGAITEEKEDGTLGLLRMTNLNPLAILLGKSTSRLCGGFLLLLVQFPFALLAVTLGGLRWDQVAACYGMLGAFLFFCANAGLLGSVLTRRTPAAAVVASVIVVQLVFGGEMTEEFLSSVVPGNWKTRFPALAGTVELWQQAALPNAISEVLADRNSNNATVAAIVLLTAGGCLSLLLAWLAFNRFCGEEKETVARRHRHWTLNWMNLLRPRNRSRAWVGKRIEALVWKDFQFMHGGWRMAGVKALLYSVGAVWLLFGEFGHMRLSRLSSLDHLKAAADLRNWDFLWGDFFLAVSGMAFLVICAESLFAASRIFRIEAKQKTLSSIAILPHDLREAVAAKIRAVLLSLLPAGSLFFLSLVGISAISATDNSFDPGRLFDTALASGMGLYYLAMTIIWAIGQAFLNLRLAAWSSLWLKWGGLPFALTVSFFANSFVITMMALIFQEAASFLLPVATWGTAIALKFALRRRLELAASD